MDRGDADDVDGLLGSRIRLRRPLLVLWLLWLVLLLMVGLGVVMLTRLLLLLGLMAVGQGVDGIGNDGGVIVIMALVDMS